MTINPLKWFEKRGQLANPPPWLENLFGMLSGGAGKTTSGYSVNQQTALSVSAVFAAVRAKSEDLAKLPFKVYSESADGAKNVEKGHPLYRLLHDEPNEEMTSISFRTAMNAQMNLWGTSFAEIEWNNSGEPVGLWPIENCRIKVDRVPVLSGRKRLRFTVDGNTEIPSYSLLVIPGFTMGGIVGEMVAANAKEAIGITLAAEQFGASFFGEGAVASGFLEVPVAIGANKKLRDTLMASIESRHVVAAGGKPKRIMPLFDGVKFTPSSVNPDESQFLETRQFQVEDVARWLRVPPWKIGQYSQSKGWNTQEQGSVDYVVDSLMPDAIRWEQEVKRKLLRDERDMYVEHSFDALLRGDALARAQSLEVRFRNGNLSANEWRRIENQNPIPGDIGNKYFILSNMTTLENATVAKPTETPPKKDKPTNPPIGE